MKQIYIQYIQSVITILLGIAGILLPHKYNIFRFKKRGVGGLLSEKIPLHIQERTPKVVGWLCIFTGVCVAILTAIFGEIPFK